MRIQNKCKLSTLQIYTMYYTENLEFLKTNTTQLSTI